MVDARKMQWKQEETEEVIEDEEKAEDTAEVDEKESNTEAADLLKIKLIQLTPSQSPSLPPSPRYPTSSASSDSLAVTCGDGDGGGIGAKEVG